MVAALAMLALTPPSPVSPRTVASTLMHCAMNTTDGSRTDLSITLRAGTHPVNGRQESNYRWTIEGDEAHYPTPDQGFGADSDENVWIDRSTLTVTKDGFNYTYRLHYDGIFQGQAATRGHLIVDRWRVGNGSIEEPIGIGLCTMTPIEVAQ